MYDVSLKRKWDREFYIEGARLEGLEKGIEQGIERGRKEAQSRFEADKVGFAMDFKRRGVSTKDISEILGLREDEIERL